MSESLNFYVRKIADRMEINLYVDDEGLELWFIDEDHNVVMRKEWAWAEIVKHAPMWHIQ